MAVNLDALRKMTEEQLRELNNGIVSVINERIRDRQRSKMMAFKVGERAAFRCSRTHRLISVVIDKMNVKTVGCTEIANDGTRLRNTWRVSPSLLVAMCK